MFARRSDLALEQDGHSRFLPWLIAFMVFLAVLALAGTFILNGLVATWDHNMSGTMTVQLPAADQPKKNQANVNKVLKILRDTPGIQSARAVTSGEMMGLLEPWLGRAASLADLPLPQLIDVTLTPGGDVQVKALAKRLDAAVPHANIDDHRVWLAKFLRLIRTVQIIALSVLILIGLATVGTVIFTTRTGLAVHQEAIEVLHLIGAQEFLYCPSIRHAGHGVGIARWIVWPCHRYSNVNSARNTIGGDEGWNNASLNDGGR